MDRWANSACQLANSLLTLDGLLGFALALLTLALTDWTEQSSNVQPSSSIPAAAPREPHEKCEHCGSSRIEISITRPYESLYEMSFRMFGHVLGGRRIPAVHDTS